MVADPTNIAPVFDAFRAVLEAQAAAGMTGDAEDAVLAAKTGADAIIVSNHGGRQVDVGQATIDSLKTISPLYKDKITVMMDSGIRGGADVARVMASGADFSFMGRTFMYGVSALGNKGGDHTIAMLKKQLTQVMEQLSCAKINDLTKKLVVK
jgi:L-lactate dehydrogenase (cytochrome)